MNLLFALASIIYTLNDKVLGKYIYLTILCLIIWIVLRTSIISDKKLELIRSKKEKSEIKK